MSDLGLFIRLLFGVGLIFLVFWFDLKDEKNRGSWGDEDHA